MWNGEDKELLLISLFTVIFNHVSQTYLRTEILLVPKADQKEPQPADCRAGALEFAY